MELKTYDASLCVMTKFFDMISGRWKPIILYLIKNDINRFGLMCKAMPKISKKILTEQLKELEQDRLITRTVVSSAYPQVVEYQLTESGISLRVLIDQMIEWGMVHFKDDYTEEMAALFRNDPEITKTA